MLVLSLRLQHGWSQQQLAEMSGVSIRTIQRIEQGKSATVETWKSLGAVFNISFLELKEGNMNSTPNNQTENLSTPQVDMNEAKRRVRKLKGFYFHFAQYLIVIPLLAGINLWQRSQDSEVPFWFFWPMLGWGIGVTFHALAAFGKFGLFGAAWEKSQLEKMVREKN